MCIYKERNVNVKHTPIPCLFFPSWAGHHSLQGDRAFARSPPLPVYRKQAPTLEKQSRVQASVLGGSVALVGRSVCVRKNRRGMDGFIFCLLLLLLTYVVQCIECSAVYIVQSVVVVIVVVIVAVVDNSSKSNNSIYMNKESNPLKYTHPKASASTHSPNTLQAVRVRIDPGESCANLTPDGAQRRHTVSIFVGGLKLWLCPDGGQRQKR